MNSKYLVKCKGTRVLKNGIGFQTDIIHYYLVDDISEETKNKIINGKIKEVPNFKDRKFINIEIIYYELLK